MERVRALSSNTLSGTGKLLASQYRLGNIWDVARKIRWYSAPNSKTKKLHFFRPAHAAHVRKSAKLWALTRRPRLGTWERTRVSHEEAHLHAAQGSSGHRFCSFSLPVQFHTENTRKPIRVDLGRLYAKGKLKQTGAPLQSLQDT